ncbi:MAG: DUF3800 domain-containing protein [Dehalococcoidia bacterium]|nr:DUF3800 domain-containing protein [Dehalococcoidia bacterium]
MYLLYLDESGSTNTEYFVVGGLAIHEQDAWSLAQRLDQYSHRLPGALAGTEIHADHIRQGRGRWRNVPKSARLEIIQGLADLLVDFRGTENSAVLFGAALHKASFTRVDPYERAYEDFFARCNGYLARLANEGDRHRCVAIADKSRLESTLQTLMAGWRATGASTGAAIGPMSSYAEVPVFVDSKASRLIQAADFVANSIYRAYATGDATLYDQLLPLFDADDGVVHGMVHLNRGHRTCSCSPCASRRRPPRTEGAG